MRNWLRYDSSSVNSNNLIVQHKGKMSIADKNSERSSSPASQSFIVQLDKAFKFFSLRHCLQHTRKKTKQPQLDLCAPLPTTVRAGARIFKELSQDVGWADFSKNLRTSPFK